MKTLSTIYMLMLTCIAQAQKHQAPGSLWTQTLPLRGAHISEHRPTVSLVTVTPDIVLVADGGSGLLALDRRAGAILWQREGHLQMLDSAGYAKPGKGDGWMVIGTARSRSGESAFLLQHTEQVTTLNPTPTGAGSSTLSTRRFTLESVAARTGKTLWRNDAPQDNMKIEIEVANGVLITKRYDARGGRHPQSFTDVVTGATIAEKTEAGRAQLRQILAANGGTAEVEFPRMRLRADTGAIELLPESAISANSLKTLTQSGISVVRIDTDDDGVGHSQWPKYLVGRDAQGRAQWQFPAVLSTDPDSGNATQPSSKIETVVNVPGTGLCLAMGYPDTFYAIRFRDGKPLWSKTSKALLTGEHSSFRLSLAEPYREGCFAIVSSLTPKHGDLPSLTYIKARTGVARPVLFDLPIQDTAVEGDTLLILTDPNTICAYAIPALLTSGQKQSPANTSSLTPEEKEQVAKWKMEAIKATYPDGSKATIVFHGNGERVHLPGVVRGAQIYVNMVAPLSYMEASRERVIVVHRDSKRRVTKQIAWELNQLRGNVRITNKAAALRYVRLRTTPQMYYFWPNPEVEIVSRRDASRLPRYGVESSWHFHSDHSGEFGIVSPRAWRVGKFTKPNVQETAGWFYYHALDVCKRDCH